MGTNRLRLLLPLAVVATLLALPGTPAGADCTDAPAYDDAVPAPTTAAPGFPHRRILTTEVNAYVASLEGANGRVQTGTFGESVNGTDLVYALVSSPENLARVDAIAAAQERLRDPRVTTPAQAQQIAATSPAIVWYTGNVHGNETSGADAAITLLHDLAARTDCAVTAVLDNLVVGIIPTQNPDGRDTFSRQNAYGFDMNRDWFAGTQPETAGKLELLRRYPPVLYIDAHEMGSSDFFFPPNADPIHHEISDESLGWINDLYGAALRETFSERQAGEPSEWNYFNYSTYDLFYMGFGDTVPSTAFNAAGMTFEKGTADPDHQRWEEQHAAGWTSLQQAAAHREQILAEHYQAHQRALADGRAGRLEPNLVVQPDNEVQFEVPAQRVRHYFLLNGRGAADTARLVDRLMGMGVEVHRLQTPLVVPDLRRYGRAARPTTVPAGSYWIPMEQPQKRWVQALLGEDPYVPFPYFYDVTSWSNPLLMNVDAALSGAVLAPDARRLRTPPRTVVEQPAAAVHWFAGDTGQAVAAALALAREGRDVRRTDAFTRLGGDRLPRGAFVFSGEPSVDLGVRVHAVDAALPESLRRFTQPKIAVFKPLTGDVALAGEAYGHLRFLLERVWQVPFTPVSGAEVAAGQLERGDFDVFLVPGVNTLELQPAVEPLQSWIEAGGVYVGTARPGGTGGTPFAVSAGFTTARVQNLSGAEVGGTAFRVNVDRLASPVTLGAGPEAFWFNLGEQALLPSETGVNAVTYPEGEDFWFSGYGTGVEPLQATAGLVDEQLGDGRVVLFSGEPNFRAFTEGVAFFLANALVYPVAAAPDAADVSGPAAAEAVARARDSVSPPSGPGRPITIAVPHLAARRAEAVLRRFSDDVRVERAEDVTLLRIPNPQGLDFEAHPFVYRLRPALEAAGVPVRSALF